MRIGTNHGSLSDRIMSYYGDSPRGMVNKFLMQLVYAAFFLLQSQGCYSNWHSLNRLNLHLSLQGFAGNWTSTILFFQ